MTARPAPLIDIVDLKVRLKVEGGSVPVIDGDDEASLAARILVQEHRIYPQAVRWFAEDRLQLVDGKVRIAADIDADRAFISPELR